MFLEILYSITVYLMGLSSIWFYSCIICDNDKDNIDKWIIRVQPTCRLWAQETGSGNFHESVGFKRYQEAPGAPWRLVVISHKFRINLCPYTTAVHPPLYCRSLRSPHQHGPSSFLLSLSECQPASTIPPAQQPRTDLHATVENHHYIHRQSISVKQLSMMNSFRPFFLYFYFHCIYTSFTRAYMYTKLFG